VNAVYFYDSFQFSVFSFQLGPCDFRKQKTEIQSSPHIFSQEFDRMNFKTGIVVALICLIGLAAPVVAQGIVKPSSSSLQSEEVKFDGHGVSLAGTLLVPRLETGKRVPGVLIIAASGQTTRDGITFGKTTHTIYRDIAEFLARRGAAVLRYDRRCVGASECKTAETFDDYIDDARNALKLLRKQAQVDQSRIFIFGHGEGALVAASIATLEEEKIAGVILTAMAGRTLGKVVRDQVITRMKESGKPQSEIDAYLAKYERVVRGIAGGRIEFPEVKLDPQDPYDEILIGFIKRYLVVTSLLINDPLQVVIGVKAPILVIQGKKDTHVAVKDAQFIEEALKRVYHPDVTLSLLDDVDHLLKTNKGAATMASLEDSSRALDPAVLKILTEWLEKRSNTVKVASDKD
jgi:pimeloyl-ACP methyl ester carboxylesterase